MKSGVWARPKEETHISYGVECVATIRINPYIPWFVTNTQPNITLSRDGLIIQVTEERFNELFEVVKE